MNYLVCIAVTSNTLYSIKIKKRAAKFKIVHYIKTNKTTTTKKSEKKKSEHKEKRREEWT